MKSYNENHLPSLCFSLSGSAAVHQLNPGEARLFAWDDPASVRALSWSCMEHSAELDLLKVGPHVVTFFS